MRDRVRRIYRNVSDGLDLIVFLNSTEPHIDRSFFYATGLTDGLFEGNEGIFRGIPHGSAVPDHKTRRLLRP